jgi:hypothetical protein
MRTLTHTLRSLTVTGAVATAAIVAAAMVGPGDNGPALDVRTPEHAVSVQAEPYCPTEDSCRPMYAHGKWTVTGGRTPHTTH